MKTAQDLSNEILTDIERDRVIAFSKDPVLFQAVKKYVLAVAFKHGSVKKGEDFVGNRNFALNLAWGATEPTGMPRTDEELGQSLRALTYAVKLVESGFREISELEVPEAPAEGTDNPSE